MNVYTSITSKSTCYNPYTCNLKYLLVLSKSIISLMAIIRFDNDAISFDSQILITFFIQFTMYYPTSSS